MQHKQELQDVSLSDVHQTVVTNQPGISKRRKILSFLGPAYLVSVGYMDPGNWATDIAGGSQFGYKLLFVLLLSNIMAMILQSFSARLGVVRGKDLAQANKELYPKIINIPLWFLAEIAIAATDLAEVIGMAIGLKLLTGMPLIWGVLLTLFDTFLLLYLQRLGMRKMEAFIIGLIAIIAVSFLCQLIFAQPQISQLATGFIPTSLKGNALFIAIGIIGATVMPHNLYLHSALVQTRKIDKTPQGIKQALKYNNIDSVVALNIAFFVNAAILILAATVFHKNGYSTIGEIEEAHKMLAPLLGNKLAPILFAVALIAAGQSSTVTGTLAGQIVMEGYLHLRINPILRRLITRIVAIVPAVIVLLINGDDNIDTLLVLSQVILSLQLAFAIIPLIHFVSDKEKMASFAINIPLRVIGWAIAVILVSLNLQLIIEKVQEVLTGNYIWAVKMLVVLLVVAFVALLLLTTFYPLFNRVRKTKGLRIHAEETTLILQPQVAYNNIAIALDFSTTDSKAINAAIGQGGKNASYLLLHVVESASAKYHGGDTADYESRKDEQRLQHYINYLQEHGYTCKYALGYRNRVTEIVRIAHENKADLMVICAHGHKGIKDFLYGQTVEGVRHQLKIPILVIS
jgi:manganese transport protein